MKKDIQGSFLLAFFFFPFFLFGQNIVILNEGVLSQKVENEITLIGKELYEKTGIFVGVAVGDKTLFEDLIQRHNSLPNSHLLLVLSKASHKVDIIGSKGALALIDKEVILSPYSGTGSILPILATKKGDIYNAAILNGYSDIVERIAQARGINLEHTIGNANRDTLNILRILIYGFVCFALLYYIQRRMKRKERYE
ncbi:hypothetical protein OQH60_06800 [Campylobacter sp. MIT 21-1685]|uniref:hypothetical protein n=1 Tax=unclassified Campylobacter TaxID=2593542 RepID=UPI00224B2B36|nr:MULTISPECIES: hypothetical protein [unclassified Campylobacter]MCX2683572.1 hypothetical protein [Campylobacter sp. MIT 21-1684]MCX2751833.1 hypothetical protein [Campylobacter sp. MIT 21-1682]MCX2808056.1 hypothetical protein [Campylobacter sp. MIT 21-1685]